MHGNGLFRSEPSNPHPIFQGLAIALMAGEIAALLLSRMAVPVLYYLMRRRIDNQ